MKTPARTSRLPVSLYWFLLLIGELVVTKLRAADPVLVGQWPGYTRGDALGCAVQGNYAYVAAATAGLVVLDISDPAQPQRVGSYDTSGYASGVAVSGDYAYVADYNAGLQVISIANPASPKWVGGYNTSGYAEDVAVSGDYAYVADGSAGLQKIRISNPASPQWVRGCSTSGYAYGVAVAGDYAYVASNDAGLQVIRIADMVKVGGYNTSGTAVDVAVSGDYAYVADGTAGLQVISITNPASPWLVGGHDTSGYAHGVAVSGGYAYVADGGAGLQVISITNPASPQWVGGYDTSGYAQGVAVAGGHAYVAEGGPGLQVISIANPASPQRVGGHDTSGYASGLAVSGDYAYVADWTAGLQVISITNPASPRWAGSNDTSGYAEEVALSGDYAYVADGSAGLQKIRISNPASPQWVRGCSTSGYAYGVAVMDGYAYVADYDVGLQVISITNMVKVGGYNTSGYAWGVAVSGDYAYVADGSAGLQVITITNPASPHQVGGYDTSGTAYGVAVSGDYAYVADGSAGLQAITITNPASPQRVGGYNTGGTAYGVAVSGGHIYVADGENGLVILRLPPEPPKITKHPANQTVFVAEEAVFTVAARGSEPLSYQWRKGEVDMIDGARLSGAKTATVIIADVQLGDAGNYSVVVSNAYGSVTSSVAVLTVAQRIVAVSQCAPVASTVLPELAFSSSFDGVNFLVGIRGSGSDPDAVGAQLLSPAGARIGPLIDTGQKLEGPWAAPRVAFGNTNYLVVWADATQQHPSTGIDVYAQFISPSGTPVGDAFPVSEASGNEDAVGVAFDGSRFLVVWSGSGGLRGRFVSLAGAVSAEELTFTTTDVRSCAATGYGAGQYLVTWIEGSEGSGGTKGRLVAPSGVMGSVLTISESASFERNPVSVAYGAGRFMVVWHYNQSTNTVWDLHGRMVLSDGSMGSSELIVAAGPNQELAFGNDVVFDGQYFLAAWTEVVGVSPTWQGTAWGRYWNPTGAPMGAAHKIAVLANFQLGMGTMGLSVGSGKVLAPINTPGVASDQDVCGRFIVRPFVQIAPAGPQSVQVSYAGILQSSTNVQTWMDFTPQPKSPWTNPVVGGELFLRSRAELQPSGP